MQRIAIAALTVVGLAATAGPVVAGGLAMTGIRSASEATADDVATALGLLRGGPDDFLILERGPETYLQTLGGPEAFLLEYRDGSADRHFGCETDRARVTAAFLSYLDGTDDWRRACRWQKVTF
jgi:hypothetical protein